ncbi:MAG: DUF86 domain-containing protein [Candidatus Roizmanbacteria bacterium]
MLNHEFIQRKIKLIQEDISRLEKVNLENQEDFLQNQQKQDAVERVLERIIMRALDINTHIVVEQSNPTEKVRGYEDTFHRLADLNILPREFAKDIAPSAGLRNRLVYEYDDINVSIIYHSAVKAIKQYSQYCQHLLNYIEKS